MINLFQRKPKAYRTPSGQLYTLFDDMAQQPHLLVAGATGSGKSVLVNGIIYNLLHDGPGKVQFVLIDPKRVELSEYRYLPHTIRYASEPADMVEALQTALAITDRRFQVMQVERSRKYNGGHVYVIIDELADLMTTNKKAVMPLIQRLCQVGRAANVHVIACTQSPVTQVIPTPIKVNFSSRVALRTSCAQDSRNIIARTGCEALPRFGYAYYSTPEGITKVHIPAYTEQQYDELITWWTSKQCIA